MTWTMTWTMTGGRATTSTASSHEYDEHGALYDEHDEHLEHGYDPFDDPASHEPRRADRHARRKGRGGRTAKRLLVFVVAIALIGAAAFAAVTVLKPVFSGFGGDTDYPGPGTAEVAGHGQPRRHGPGHRQHPLRRRRGQDGQGVHRRGRRQPGQRRASSPASTR